MSHRLELLEESAEAVALGLDVLRGAAHGRGGRGETADIGKRAGASARTRHAEPPLLGLGFNGSFSRVVGAGREGLGLLGDLRLGRRRGLTEVEEALLRRSHLPTTRHASARHDCAGLPCRELRCYPAPSPPPPPPATDACCNSAREGNDRRRAGSHAPVPPATRAAHAEALVCWAPGAALMLTMATSAVRDTVTRCTPGTVVGGVNAVVRLPGTSVGERQHTSLSYTRQGGPGAGAAAHPTMVRTESVAICENGQGGSGQARRRGVARRGDPPAPQALCIAGILSSAPL